MNKENFSKTFNSEKIGQIVVIKQENDYGAPEIRTFFEPKDFGVCNFAISYKESNAGYKNCDDSFDNLTLEGIEKSCLKIIQEITG